MCTPCQTAAVQGRHYCICLAESLEEVLPELLEVGESVLPFLPSHCKVALLARAKRQVGLPPRDGSTWQGHLQAGTRADIHRLLQDLADDRALRLLTDADWSVLDASDCTQLTTEGLLTALRLAPDLRWLDITGCNASAALLRALPTLCPGITVLRLGELSCLRQFTSCIVDVSICCLGITLLWSSIVFTDAPASASPYTQVAVVLCWQAGMPLQIRQQPARCGRSRRRYSTRTRLRSPGSRQPPATLPMLVSATGSRS